MKILIILSQGGDLSSGMEALELGGMSSTPENPNVP